MEQYLTYEEFGAIGDGVHDDMEALCRTHEKANELFRQGKIRFLDIARAVENALETAEQNDDYSLEDVFETDRLIRLQTERLFV